jgi:hypothetical protein
VAHNLWLALGRVICIHSDMAQQSISGLAQNLTPPSDRWEAAQRLGRKIVAAVDQRDAIIEREGIDRRFALGDSNWAADAANDYIAAYRLLATLDWEDVRYLRFRAQCFTGFSLRAMRSGRGLRSTAPVPEDYDSLILHDAAFAGLEEAWRSATVHMPPDLRIAPPAILGEAGLLIDGVIVNHDSIVYQERLNLLQSSGVIEQLRAIPHPRILEIGGGYGALACALTTALPDARYMICDLPESLLFSGLYLTIAEKTVTIDSWTSVPESRAGIRLLPNYLFDRLVATNGQFDLAINTLSLNEMSAYQIERYGNGIAALLGAGGVFFEQNQTGDKAMTDCKSIIARHFKRRSTLPMHSQGLPDLWHTA